MKKGGYEAANMDMESFPFQVYDVLFNSFWVKSNESLTKIAVELEKYEDAGKFQDWAKQAKKSMNELMWDEDDGMYYSYDRQRGEKIRVKTVGSFTAFLAGIPGKVRAEKMVRALHDPANGFNAPYMIPSTSTAETGYYNPEKFWRGSVWPFTNYIVWQGLKDCGLDDEANRLRDQTLGLASSQGICENYSPDGKGKGAGNFSPMAAVTLEMLYDKSVSTGVGDKAIMGVLPGSIDAQWPVK